VGTVPDRHEDHIRPVGTRLVPLVSSGVVCVSAVACGVTGGSVARSVADLDGIPGRVDALQTGIGV